MPRGLSASERARRLIALTGFLTKGARIPLDQLAEQLGTTPADLTNDLETLSYCGVEPYTYDVTCQVSVSDGYVELFGELPALRGPVRLSNSEAAALASALQNAGFTADNPLTAKLLQASSTAFDAEGLEQTVRSAIVTHEHSVYGTLAVAAHGRDVVAIEYSRSGEDDVSCREVEPVSLFAERGAWYLTAWCRHAGAWRTFRVDRIRSAQATGEQFAERAGAPQSATAFDVDGLPVARLRFAPGEPFTAREWPGARMVEQEADRSVIVEVPYAGMAWLARRVAARLGRVEALEPPEMRDAVRELAASS
jgi:predicted DNA-binding transcriptional regulator YafY